MMLCQNLATFEKFPDVAPQYYFEKMVSYARAWDVEKPMQNLQEFNEFPMGAYRTHNKTA